MPTFPIPIFSALVLLFLFLRLWLVQRRISALAILVAICAAQALIIALAQHYSVTGARTLQPITATLIPPVAWLAFLSTAVRTVRAADLLHALVPIAAIAALLTAPPFLDVLIPGAFLFYGLAILIQSLKGPDAQPRMHLESGDLPSRIWLVIGAALVASAFSDVLIVAAQAAGAGHLQPWIVSLYSVGNLLLIGVCCLSDHLRADSEGEEGEAKQDTGQLNGQVWEHVERYMAEHRPYLDPDLTLSKLARKTGIPAKTLSTTINRATQGNVSRFVNDARIEAAKQALLAGETVTSAMLTSGFNTKSNFNREFLRVTETSPSKWLAEQSG
ncbi:MAG: AraC family transcriptional regulator [Pseudomonadota bacterium]